MFASKHSCHGIPTSGHSSHCIPTRVHLHHDIPTRSICIITYPLEGICTIRFLHLHLCKETFASRLNMCTGTIMDKLCICTPVWDIYIMKIAPLKGEQVHHMDISYLHPYKKSIYIGNEKSRLA